MKNILFLLISVFIFNNSLFAQLTVSDGHTAQELADIFTGQSVNAQNCEIVQGESLQYGSFTFTGDGLDVSSGVILSTGNIFNAVGPNDNPATSTGFGGPGNILFDLLPINYGPNETFDAVLFQFDFQVLSDSIEFEYIFLSEEYNEILGDPEYNDAFAFFISGPGIDGEKNLAVVPGQTVPVTANTINNDSFWQFYQDNEDGNTNIEFDGFTTLMKAKTKGLIPCETYTLKLILADGGDDYTDSGVLLKENSLSQSVVTVSTETYSGNDIAIESCVNANFLFELDHPQTEDIEIDLTIKGTAVNGVDYEYIDPHVVIPAGQTTATLIVKAINDGLSEGQESIYMIYTPVPCQAPDTAKLFIDDYDQIIFTANGVDALCNGSANGEIDIDIQGGFTPYTFYVTDTLSLEQQIFTELPITGLDSGTYKLDVIDSYGCKAEDIVFGGEFNAGQTFLPDGTGVSYESVIEISGFQEGQLLETPDQIVNITAVLEHSYVNDLSVLIEAPNGSQVILKQFDTSGGGTCDLGEPVASGPIDTWNSSNITPGLGYEYTWNHNPVFETMNQELLSPDLPYHTYVSTWGNTLSDYYLPAGSYSSENPLGTFVGTELNGDWKIVVTDNMGLDNGYIFSWNISLSSDRPDSIVDISHPPIPIVSSVNTDPTCGESNGSIDISVSDGNPPFSYLWNTGATAQDLFDVSSGAYDVNITDYNSCVYNFLFNLSDAGGSLSLSADVFSETCPESSDGSIDLTADGTEPITYSWNTGSTNQDIDNLAPGNYTVNVSDGNNCNAVETYVVEEATEINITSEITDENCGDHEGSIDITVAGGIQPYIFLWSNGETTEDIDELAQGDYTVTITDLNGCTKEESFHITNYVGNCIVDCDLEITNADLTDESCGDGNGAIDLTIFTSFSPYNVSWNNGATTDNISSLSEGEYIITITDAEGCELVQIYNIENQSGDFVISDFTTTDETCGNGTGSIDITIYGGAGPYSYLWSNAATTEDILDLNAGEYTVTVTDANLCSVSEIITVNNNSGDLEQTWGNAVNEICGNSEGSIDILINGGSKPYNYNWSNGAVTEDLIGISAGTYNCIVTDNDGCSIATETYNIDNEPGTLNIDDIDVDNEICGNSLGEIEIVISGGTEPYIYNWSNGETTKDIFNLSAGTYSAIINDDNGCLVNTGELTIINESGTMELSDIIVTDEVCNNNSGEIDITISGGTEPYAYNWSNGNTAEDLTGLNEGNYSCQIIDDNGCLLDINTTVNNDQGTLAVDNLIVTDEDCGQSNGAVDLQISGGNAPVFYNWNNGADTQDLTSIPAGNYNCIITDNLGCSVNANADVVNNAGTLSLDAYALINETCGNSDGSIDITVSGDETPITFLWSNGATTEDISGIPAGEYSCTVTDDIGCSIIAGPYTINNFASTLSVDNIDVVNEVCEDGQGSIDLTVSGGTVPINYYWSTGATTEDISNLSAGIYTYTITDDEDCSVTGNVEIFNDAGTLSLDSYIKTDESCNANNGAIDITISGGIAPVSFLWNTGHTTEDIDNLNEGIYQVTITDNNNCQIVSDEFNVINTSGDIFIEYSEVTDENCGLSDGAIDITPANGVEPYSFAWSNGADTEDVENLSAENYSVMITDDMGCSHSESFTVENVTNGFEIADAVITNETCGTGNGSIDITVIGGTPSYNYSWSTGATTEDITDLSAGDYTCTVTDDVGCSLTETYEVINTTTGLEITLESIQNDYCNGHTGAINLNVHSGAEPYTFIWSNGATTEDITDLAAGTYAISVTDNSGCETSSEYQILNIINENLGITNIQVTDDVCNQGEGIIEFEPLVPRTYIYKLNDAGDTNNPLFENLMPDNYIISIHDGGCVAQENVTVGNEVSFTVNVVNVNPEFCGGSDGGINISVNPSNGNYSYEWSNGATTQDLNNIPAGTYICQITDDDEGCTDEITVDVPAEGWFETLTDITNEMCGQANGAIDLTVIPNDTYTYQWSNGATTQDIENLSAGDYSCVVTDDYGCEIIVEETIVNNTGTLNVTEYVHDDNCGVSSGYINLTITGAPNGYSVLWNTGATTDNIENLQAGDYSVTVTNDETGCEFYDEYTIETVGIYTMSAEITNSSCQTCNDGSIDLSVDPNTFIFDFSWSNSETTEDITNLLPDDYTVTVNNEYGCVYSEIYTVSYESGIDVRNQDLNVSIYPNPVENILYVKYEFSNNEDIHITIYNMLGKIISEDMIVDDKGIKQINTSNLGAGIYFVKINTSKASRTFKLYKNTK
ncbi:MAG: choice-of-anchor L domain-containing protein [Bacteroidales bacterium]|nr:choice-of-anchor L domain-containing protein [Bacteroidales bacterium]